MFGYKGSKSFVGGNSVKLMVDGEQFFPQLLRRINRAKKEIFIETFILAEDRIGKALQKALIKAARRGVWISVTADSYGTFFLSNDYIQTLTDAGIVFQIYDPQPSLLKSRPMVFRRLHRKLAVIDGQYAFIGGINLCYDHMMAHGPGGKKDFAVEVAGPVAREVRRLCQSYVRDANNEHLGELRDSVLNPQPAGPTEVAFVIRDNKRNRTEIEHAYLAGIRMAKKRIIIANAYFFPGYRVMRALRQAARRGVEVHLLLQGNPDIPFALRAARCLYDGLTRHDIKIYEYLERPLHAKVAVIDDNWATVGSSNLDPWSLSLNLEANVFIRDQHFNEVLAAEIQKLISVSRLIEHEWVKRRNWWTQTVNFFLYHGMRHLPNLVSWLPHHRPKIRQIRTYFKTVRGESRDREARREFPESRNARRVLFKQDYKEINYKDVNEV